MAFCWRSENSLYVQPFIGVQEKKVRVRVGSESLTGFCSGLPGAQKICLHFSFTAVPVHKLLVVYAIGLTASLKALTTSCATQRCPNLSFFFLEKCEFLPQFPSVAHSPYVDRQPSISKICLKHTANWVWPAHFKFRAASSLHPPEAVGATSCCHRACIGRDAFEDRTRVYKSKRHLNINGLLLQYKR